MHSFIPIPAATPREARNDISTREITRARARQMQIPRAKQMSERTADPDLCMLNAVSVELLVRMHLQPVSALGSALAPTRVSRSRRGATAGGATRSSEKRERERERESEVCGGRCFRPRHYPRIIAIITRVILYAEVRHTIRRQRCHRLYRFAEAHARARATDSSHSCASCA